MHAKRISWIFLFALLIAAPASAQWFIHYMTYDNEMWRKSPHAFADKEQAIQNARNHCLRNSNLRAAKFVGPSGETTYQCQTLAAGAASQANAPAAPSATSAVLPGLITALPQSTGAKGSAIQAMRRIVEAAGATTSAPDPAPTASTQALALHHCEQDSQLSMLADCQCARTTFAARPSSSGNMSGSRLAVEACPASEAHIASEYHRQCVKDGFNLLPEDVDPVCRCMATDFAARYTANPVFDVPHLSQLRETAFRSCMARR